MSTALTSTGVTFPDATTQTTAAGASPATGQKAHAWAHWDSGTATFNASYGCSSLTDRGSYSRVNFTTTAGSIYYGVGATAGAGAKEIWLNSVAATYCEFAVSNSSGSIMFGHATAVFFTN